MTKVMKNNLSAYLNDHLAGSVAALELIDDLTNASKDERLKQFLGEMHHEIQADQKVLEGLIDRAHENESVTRKAAAWISEKVARAKFKIAGEDSGGLGLVQALELLALGIHGKELLWQTVATLNWSGLKDVDLAELERRAVEQQQRVEEKRLEAARAAFGNKAL